MYKYEWDTEFSNEHGVRQRAAPNLTGGDDGVNLHSDSSEHCAVSLTA